MSRKTKNIFSYSWCSIAFILLLYIYIHRPSDEWLLSVGGNIIRLVVTTTVATVLGTVIEERSWNRIPTLIIRPVVRWAKLPEVCGGAIVTSFFSLPTGNAILAAQLKEKTISTFQLHICAMASSFLSLIQHSLRILYPIVATIGIVGIKYYSVIYSGAFLSVFLGFLLHRFVSNSNDQTFKIKEHPKEVEKDWNTIRKKAKKRALMVAKRMFSIALPLYICFSYLGKIQFFDTIGHKYLGELSILLPIESIGVMLSMMGGILSASAVGVGLLQEGIVSESQLLLALLCGNIISSPIRTLRRSLPAAMSIFPAKEAVTIVLLNQGTRLLFTLLFALILSFYLLA